MRLKRKRLKFSIGSLLIAILAVALFFGFYASRASSIRQHHYAIRQLHLMGAKLHLMTPDGGVLSDAETNAQIERKSTETMLDVLLRRPSIGIADMDFSDPKLESDDIQDLVDQMRKVIELPMNETFEGIGIWTDGNGSITPEMVETIRRELPSFYLYGNEHLPNPDEHPIRIGMTTKQVTQAVGKAMYDHRTDVIGDPLPFIKMAGSIHETYKNAEGTLAWTYTTDDTGVALIVIDFDENQQVAKVSFSHGIPDRLRRHRLPNKPCDVGYGG
jgi:hypothetical protein